MDKKKALDRFAFYRQAPKSIQEELEQLARPVHLEPGSFFIHEGDMTSHFALVCSGDLRVFKTSENGRQITLYYVNDNQACLINMLSIFLGTQSPASAIAETDVEALIIPAETFRSLLRTSDEIRNYVFTMISKRMIDVITLVDEITFQKMDKRLADYLLHSFEKQNPSSHSLTITHQVIAEDLGSAREVISRLLKKFERSGAIQLGRGKIQLLDKSILQDFLRK